MNFRSTRASLLFATGFLVITTLGGITMAQSASPSTAQEFADIDERFYTNTVRSTSLDTPGAATLVPENETTVIVGKIVGVDGKPAVGAVVWGASLSAMPPIREHAKTDAEGKFQLKLMPKVEWSIHAFQGDQSADLTRDVTVNISFGEVANLDGQLAKHCLSRVQVLEYKTGKAVSKARVYLDDGRVLVSDESGNVDASGLEQGIHDAVVLARGFEVYELSLHCLPDGANSIRIHLVRANKVVGRLRNKEGKPVANGWVGRRTSMYGSLAGDGTYMLTDSQGRFAGSNISTLGSNQMQDMLDRNHEICRAGAPEYLSKQIAPLSNANKTPDPFDIVLNAIADYKPRERQPGQSFQVTVLVDGQEEECTDQLARASRESRDQVSIKLKQRAETTERVRGMLDGDPLVESQTVQGQVLGPDGGPLTGARIEPYNDFYENVFGSSKPNIYYTDGLGVFNINGGDSYNTTLKVSHGEYATKMVKVNEFRGGTGEIALSPRMYFYGTVTDEAGAPIKDFTVSILPIQPPPIGYVGFNGRWIGHPVALQYTSDRGEFHISNDLTSERRFKIVIYAEGMMDLIDEIDFGKMPERSASEKTFQMKRIETLKINIASADTNSEDPTPLKNVTVTIMPHAYIYQGHNPFYGSIKLVSQPLQIQDIANADKVEVNAPTGAMAIQAPGFARQFFEWQTATPQYDLTLVPESIIAGSIPSKTDKAGSKKRTYTLWIASMYDRYVIEKQITDQFEIPNLAAGLYRVLLIDSDQNRTTTDVFIQSGERLDLEYLVGADGQLGEPQKIISGKRLNDKVQFTVNGKPQRYRTVDEYLAAIKDYVAARSEKFAQKLTKEKFLEALGEAIMRKQMEDSWMRPGPRTILPSVLQELTSNEEWPSGINFSYEEVNGESIIALTVPTPNDTYAEKVLGLRFEEEKDEDDIDSPLQD